MSSCRAANANAMRAVGFHYCADVAIGKNPQSQAQRTHDHNLLFATLDRDSAGSMPTRNDYLLVFRADGKNEVPVTSAKRGEVSKDDWIRWARGVWNDIDETDVLKPRGTGAADDEAHVCPLQLEVIRRCVLLWSNPDELVLDPFNGIGSTSYVAVKHRRRALGMDLKPENHLTAARTLGDLVGKEEAQLSLLDMSAP